MPLGNDTRIFAGTPPVSAFASSQGNPIVIDTTTSIAYYLKNGVVTAIGGGGGGSTVTIATLLGNNLGDASLGSAAPTFAKVITSGGSAQTIEASVAAAVGDRIEATFTGVFENTNIPAVTIYFDLALFFNGAGINQWVEQSIDSSPTRVQTLSFNLNRVVQAGDISGGNVLVGLYARIYSLPVIMLNTGAFVPTLSIKNFGP